MRRKGAILAFLMATMLVLTGCDSSDYKKAMNLYDQGDYAQAVAIFESLGDYSDSQEMVAECKYQEAVTAYNDGRYSEAKDVFLNIEDYSDSMDLLADCYINLSYEAIHEHDYSSAVASLRECQKIGLRPDEVQDTFYSIVVDYVKYKGSMLKSAVAGEEVGIAITKNTANDWVAYIAIDNDTKDLRFGNMVDKTIYTEKHFIFKDSSDVVTVGRTSVIPLLGAYVIEMGKTTTEKSEVNMHSAYKYTEYAGETKDINGKVTRHTGIQDGVMLKSEVADEPLMQFLVEGVDQLLKEIDSTLEFADLGFVGMK